MKAGESGLMRGDERGFGIEGLEPLVEPGWLLNAWNQKGRGYSHIDRPRGIDTKKGRNLR